jgi:hypothetical protein
MFSSRAISAGPLPAAGVVRGDELRRKHPKAGALLLQLVDEVEHIAGAPTEPVEFHDDQFITVPDKFHDPGQFIPALPRLAADLLFPDDRATGRKQPVILDLFTLAA